MIIDACVWVWRTATLTVRAVLAVTPGGLGARAAAEHGQQWLAGGLIAATVVGLAVGVAIWAVRNGGAR